MNSFKQNLAIALLFLIGGSSCMSLTHANHSTPNKMIDPVCGQVVAEDSTITTKVGQTTYYFDSEECRSVFLKDPERFANQNNTGSNHSMHWGILGGSVMAISMVVMMLLF